MKKIIIIISLIINISGICYAEFLTNFYEPYKSPHIFIDNEQFYIFDSKSCQLHLFSSLDFKIIKIIGKKGEGPGEFMDATYFQLCDDYLFFSCTNKVLYFTTSGDFLKEMKIPPTPLRMNVKSAGENLVGEELSINKVVGTTECTIKLFSTEGIDIKTLYSYFPTDKFITHPSGMKQMYSPIKTIPKYKIHDNYIYFADPQQGYHFSVFSLKGELINVIKSDCQMIEIKASAREKSKNDFKSSVKQIWSSIKDRFRFEFPKYYPAFTDFFIDNERIFVVNDGVEQIEASVINFKGKLLKTVSLPKASSYTYYANKLYYLVDNEDNETWELHVEEIE